MRVARRAVVIALASGLLATACTSSNKQTSGPPVPGSSDKTVAPKTNPDAVLRLASTIGDRTYDPAKPPTCPGEFWTLQLVYARLIDLTPDFKLAPMLADSWKFSADGSALTLALHKGVKFHDGSPFNAQAVKANLDRVKTDPKSTQKSELASVASVAVIDDATVQINVKPGTGYELPMKLSGCAGMIVNPASFAKPDLDQTGDGLGPYVMKPGTFKAGSSATLVRSTDPWWGDAAVGPHFSEIQTFPIQDVNARVNAVQSGQIDVADITPDQFGRAQQMATSGFQFKKYESQLDVAVALNLNSPVLQNAAVRQAMNLAIDRQGIDQAVFAGGCTPSVQPAAPTGLGYDPALETTWAYNVAKAKQLLSAAGVGNITVNAIQHTNASYSGANDAVAAQLKQVGITFALSQPIVSTQAIPKYQSGAADAFGFPLGGSLSPVGVLTDFAFGPYVVKGTTTPAIKAAATGLLDPKLSDADRQAKAVATNQAITNDATFLTLCRIQRGAIASAKIVNLAETSEIQLGTIDVERMAMTS